MNRQNGYDLAPVSCYREQTVRIRLAWGCSVGRERGTVGAEMKPTQDAALSTRGHGERRWQHMGGYGAAAAPLVPFAREEVPTGARPCGRPHGQRRAQRCETEVLHSYKPVPDRWRFRNAQPHNGRASGLPPFFLCETSTTTQNTVDTTVTFTPPAHSGARPAGIITRSGPPLEDGSLCRQTIAHD